MILVTGAEGFVGWSLCRALGREEIPFRPYMSQLHNDIALRREIEGIETVIHLAGAERRGRRGPVEYVDVEGTRRLLAACQRAEVKRFITVSRLHADAHSLYPLLRAKGKQEKLIEQSGIPYTIIRSATLFGRFDYFLNFIDYRLRRSWPLAWLPGGGQVMMQPFWVEDLAQCLVLSLSRDDLINKTVEVAGEERLSYREIVEMVVEVTGRQRLYVPIRLLLYRYLARLAYSWQRKPWVTRFMVDRFAVPDIAPLDATLRVYHFRPHRIGEIIAFMRRMG
ncbi:MAG TPA: NAD(P)H-binding protein [Anaerolineae bacterium]|nr:NAD(P)H-binding protein [Anaerolineae bacterium]